MSMLDMLEKELNNQNIFEGNLPEIVKAVADSIPSRNIPYRMKITFAVSEIILYASQFRKNIKHWNDSIIPINGITFCIAKSGASKDSSVKAARKCFESGYEIINARRKEAAIVKAIEEATKAGCDAPHLFGSYKDYLITPNPLFVAISTSEGFIQHLNDLSNDTLGAGFIYSGEIGAELAGSSLLLENIKILSELYDEGSKEVKILKSRENQSREVKHLPVSALFIGSQDNLLYDDTIKRKFRTEFNSKLARRSFFIFINEEVEQDNYRDIEALFKIEREVEDKSVITRREVDKYIKELTEYLTEKDSTNVSISEETRNLFLLYKRYNEELASTIDNSLSMTRLTRTHMQWKALKLAGAFAVIQGEDEISADHYKGAIEFVELISSDIASFEKELVKEPYELFADYCRYYMRNNEFSISLHDLRKAGFIPMKGQSAVALKELVKLVNSYDKDGIYKLSADHITFKLIEKSDNIILSYLPIKWPNVVTDEIKKRMSSKVASGYQWQELKFSELNEMLEGDYAYSPFRFTNGIRGKDNIDSTCKWIVLDIDTSEITDDEAHKLLSDINHYIVRTSDNNNPNKFRVLIELDAEVDIPAIQWKTFIKNIVDDLGLISDPLPKAQIYYSYSNRRILSSLDASPLAVKPYLDILASKIQEPKIDYTTKQVNNMLADPFTTFELAFNAKSGEGGRKLIWAARRARELGASKEYTLDLLHKINEYWVKSYPPDEFEIFILNQVRKWEF